MNFDIPISPKNIEVVRHRKLRRDQSSLGCALESWLATDGESNTAIGKYHVYTYVYIYIIYIYIYIHTCMLIYPIVCHNILAWKLFQHFPFAPRQTVEDLHHRFEAVGTGDGRCQCNVGFKGPFCSTRTGGRSRDGRSSTWNRWRSMMV